MIHQAREIYFYHLQNLQLIFSSTSHYEKFIHTKKLKLTVNKDKLSTYIF